MIIEGLCDDPHVQNTCHKCLTRINSIKDETVVFNLLLSYLKSKSMNIRYAAVKVLLHLSQSSLIPLNYTRIVLNDLMLDPSSNEDLWLIETQDEVWKKHVYYYAGPLREVVYSLLVRHQTGDTNRINRRNQFNTVDADFAESEKASRFASCLIIYSILDMNLIKMQIHKSMKHKKLIIIKSIVIKSFLYSYEQD
jgi:hypothetical protein